MKRKLLCLWAAMVPAFAAAQTNDAALLKTQHVARVRIRVGTRLAATERYDARGNLIASWEDNFLLESVQRSLRQQFNAQNQLLWYKLKVSGDRDTLFYLYRYNERQQLVAVTEGYTGTPVERRAYDATGHLVRITRLGPTGQPTSEETFVYNKRGQEVASRVVMEEGARAQVKRTTYDPRGRPVREERFHGDELFSTQRTAYGPNGQKSTVTYADPDETTGRAFSYDRRNRVVSRRHFTGEQGPEATTGTEAWTYTPTGLIQTYSENVFSSSGATRVFSYDYTYAK